MSGMIEVHAGSRPGRPILLLLACAGLLVIVLGLAGFQVASARALGAPIAIPDTPLTVRMPRDYAPIPDEPNTFVLRSDLSRADDDTPFVRRFRFTYLAPALFQPPELILKQLARRNPNIAPPAPATIAGYNGFQIVIRRVLQHRRQPLVRETAVRVAAVPGGGTIMVEYQPLLAMQPADFEQLDQISAAVRVEGLAPAETGSLLQERAGLRFAVDPSWRIEPSVRP